MAGGQQVVRSMDAPCTLSTRPKWETETALHSQGVVSAASGSGGIGKGDQGA